MTGTLPIDGPDASHICPRCGGDNRCGFGREDTPCWCATGFTPRAPPDPAAGACYCARCLQELHDRPDGPAGAT